MVQCAAWNEAGAGLFLLVSDGSPEAALKEAARLTRADRFKKLPGHSVGHGLGLRAILSDDDGKTWDFQSDRMVISDVNHDSSGGGFGNTVQLPDESLVSVYSYRGKDGKTHIESVRWKLPANQ